MNEYFNNLEYLKILMDKQNLLDINGTKQEQKENFELIELTCKKMEEIECN